MPLRKISCKVEMLNVAVAVNGCDHADDAELAVVAV